MKKFVREYTRKVNELPYRCKRCGDVRFKTRKELSKHLKEQHGHVKEGTFITNKINKKVELPIFNPEKEYTEWLSKRKVSKSYHEPDDPDIPEKDRIYSSERKHWCSKTTKRQANNLFKSLDKLHEDMKTRGTIRAPIAKEDRVMSGRLKLKRNDREIDVIYIYDNNIKEFRIYTDSLKYGPWKEIVYDNKKLCFVIKNIDELRVDWNKTHSVKEKPKSKGDTIKSAIKVM